MEFVTAPLVDGDWRGEALYQTCFRAVDLATQASPQKRSLRCGQTKSLGVVSSPFGTIELSVIREYCDELEINHIRYIGKLLREDGGVCGRCFFSTYRPVRGAGWLDADTLFSCMDALSQEALEFIEILSNADDADFEETFNPGGLLTADELWLAPELRGTLAWKLLYFCTMSAVFLHQRRLYEDFVFKAHPLVDHDAVDRPSSAELRLQARQLRRFYAAHLDAKIICNDGKPTEYMRAPVPDALSHAFLAR